MTHSTAAKVYEQTTPGDWEEHY